MHSRNALNRGRFAAVTVLGLVAWLQPGHKPPAAPPTLTAIKPHDVHTIRIERRQGKTIELAKVDGQWRMRAPIDARVNDWRAELRPRGTPRPHPRLPQPPPQPATGGCPPARPQSADPPTFNIQGAPR